MYLRILPLLLAVLCFSSAIPATAPSAPEDSEVCDDNPAHIHGALAPIASFDGTTPAPIMVSNSHLERFQSAVDAEVLEVPSRDLFKEIMKRIEELLLELASKPLMRRVCIMHSSTLLVNNVNILEEMLAIIHSAGLSAELDALWVLNYGYSVPHTLKYRYANVSWVEMGSSATLFEIPTLEFLRQVSERAVTISPDLQVLYIHTKGASYARRYSHIEDWRNMMMYYLVEEHRACKHLLQSGVFDVVGVNRYLRMLSGNFWWARASYIATLRPFTENDKKYDAEYWILSGDFCFHIYYEVLMSGS
jgi:hypothetical protein